jgi:hypothetical protein
MYPILRSRRYKLNIGGGIINGAAGKIMGKEERPQRNRWFDEESQIILEDEN